LTRGFTLSANAALLVAKGEGCAMRIRAGQAWGLLVAGLLGGCAATTEPSLPLPPEPVAVEPAAGGSIPVARSYSEVIVRTFVETAQGDRREVGGAECLLEAANYGARFRSPGRVLVPVPRVNVPILGVACEAGEFTGVARRAPARLWADPYRFRYGYPYGWPYRYGWHDDPFWGPRSGIWLGATFGDPYWSYGSWGRRGLVTGYPDVEVLLR
jgi:hypothetical protein